MKSTGSLAFVFVAALGKLSVKKVEFVVGCMLVFIVYVKVYVV